MKEVTFNDLERYHCGKEEEEVIVLVVAKINMRETVRDASFRNVGTDLEIPIRIVASKRIVSNTTRFQTENFDTLLGNKKMERGIGH